MASVGMAAWTGPSTRTLSSFASGENFCFKSGKKRLPCVSSSQPCRACVRRNASTMATAPAPGATEQMASLESQLADTKAQAEADAVNAEHLSQAMETRYASLAGEHAKVRERLPYANAYPPEGMRHGFVRISIRSDNTHDPHYVPPAAGTRTQSHEPRFGAHPLFKISRPTRSLLPTHPQAVEERDALKAHLARSTESLGKSTANANALDVALVQHVASVDRLKVRARSFHRSRLTTKTLPLFSPKPQKKLTNCNSFTLFPSSL